MFCAVVGPGSGHAVRTMMPRGGSLGTACGQGQTSPQAVPTRGPAAAGGSQAFVKRLPDSVVAWSGTVTPLQLLRI